jgi:hypothetical protein
MSELLSIFVESVVQGLNDYLVFAIPLFVLCSAPGWTIARSRNGSGPMPRSGSEN